MTFSYHDILGYLQLWPTYFIETVIYVKDKIKINGQSSTKGIDHRPTI